MLGALPGRRDRLRARCHGRRDRLRARCQGAAIAFEHDVKAAAIARAWLMHRPTVTAPLVSATSSGQLDDLLAATAVALDTGQVVRLDSASYQLA
ncbi:aldo/keto reductase [Nocardioides bigeumensis]|uniref:aldo/keto reductase n=1 Tax=Nocardioides bigeumensis TaxID=433657 RepID=UPI0031CE61ED